MEKAGKWIEDFRGFLENVKLELLKCSWPTRPELIESTVVVVVSCLILATFVGVSDGVLMSLMGVIIR